MAAVVQESGLYKIEGIGVVRINLKLNARNVVARWKGGQLVVSAPRGIDYDQLRTILLKMKPRLENKKPEMLYRIGQIIELTELTIEIAQQRHSPDKMLLHYKEPKGRIEVGTSWDMESPNTIKQISKMVCRIAQSVAPNILIPRAKQISARIGKSPLMWTISNGHRTLGQCSSKGVISLSYALVFYPQHLRDYVICHELAHLSEMNHSARFHAICDSYCAGHERELVEQLKAFPLPIVR